MTCSYSQMKVKDEVDEADCGKRRMAGHEREMNVLQPTTADAEVCTAVLGDVRVRILTVAKTVHH